MQNNGRLFNLKLPQKKECRDTWMWLRSNRGTAGFAKQMSQIVRWYALLQTANCGIH
jgi:hypothetical protein